MRFSQSYSLVFFGLLLAGPMVMSRLLPDMKSTLETASDLKASMVQRHPREAGMAHERGTVPPEEILRMPMEDRPNLSELPTRTPAETDLEKTIAWGNSYGYGGKICSAIWGAMKNSWSRFFQKLTRPIHGQLSEKDYQVLYEADPAGALVSRLLGSKHSPPQGSHSQVPTSDPHPDSLPPFTHRH